MILTIATDILFDREPDAEHLREAAARAFAVRPDDVAVGPLWEINATTGPRVVFQRQPEDMPGDFPIWYGLTVAAQLLERVNPALDIVTHQLGLVALSDADAADEVMLHLPDGSDRVIHLPQGGDGGFHLTPPLRNTIAIARRNAGASALNRQNRLKTG